MRPTGPVRLVEVFELCRRATNALKEARGKMGSDAPTAEELGVDQLAHARFCKTLRFYKSVAARQASLADVALACLLERCTSDFGLWLQLPDHPVYCRLTQAEKHARALSVVAGRYSTPSGELPEATKAKVRTEL